MAGSSPGVRKVEHSITVYECFRRWSRNGLFETILDRLRSAAAEVEAIDSDLWCVDGTNVRAARCAAGAKKGGLEKQLLAMKR